MSGAKQGLHNGWPGAAPACRKLNLSGVRLNAYHSLLAQGGLLEDDWATPVRDKLDRLARICLNPSRLEVDGSGRLLRVHAGGGGGSGIAEVRAARGRRQPMRAYACTVYASRCLCTTLLQCQLGLQIVKVQGCRH